MKIAINPCTHIPITLTYECRSINISKSNYTIRNIPDSYVGTMKRETERKVEKKPR